jgi:hypothetical protein
MAERYIRRRVGDRKDGRRLRTITPYAQFLPFVMRPRCDAFNFFEDSVEVSAIDRWIRLKRSEGLKDMTVLHLVVAAYVRTIAHRPALNRFVAGQQLYARDGIDAVLTASRTAAPDSSLTAVKVRFDPTDTVYDVYRKIHEKVDSIKADQGANSTEQLAGTLAKMPRFILRLTMTVLRALDYFGWLDPSLVAASPYHGSLLISDVGSYGNPPLYHHLYNFGNLPVSISLGHRRTVRELDGAGVVVERKYMDYAVVLDERIADAAFYVSAFKYVKYYLSNPSLLEKPPERVDEDIL